MAAAGALIIAAFLRVAASQAPPGDCDAPVGLESGVIPDSALSASSSYVGSVGPRYGRLRSERGGGAWCPKSQVSRGVREWLAVDLSAVHVITAVHTQGRYDHARGQEYAEEYSVEYWRPGLRDWRTYRRWDGKQILSANSDTSTVVTQRLLPSVLASHLRLLPHSVHPRTVCLRFELSGCLAQGGVQWYSVPEDSVAVSRGLSDGTYDGEYRAGRLVGGLGALVDGDLGSHHCAMLATGKGTGWVGWTNDSFPEGYIDLLFEFDQLRNFSAVHLAANNCFSRDTQVFRRALVWVGAGGRPVSFSYMPDLAMESPRAVSIRLQHRVGRSARLRLFFADAWIMISEVTFDTVTVSGNFSIKPNAENQTEEIEEDYFEEGEIVPENFEDVPQTAEAAAGGDAAGGGGEDEGGGPVEALIGALAAATLLLLAIFLATVAINRRRRAQLGSSPTLLRNPFSGVTLNMKDLLLSVVPVPAGGGTAVRERQQAAYEEDISGGYNALSSLTDGADSRSLVMSVEGDSGRAFHTLHVAAPATPASRTASPRQHRKRRCHTTPKDRRLRTAGPPPTARWNVCPVPDRPYRCREAEVLPEVSRDSLEVVERSGVCHLGEVLLCEAHSVPEAGCTVSVRTLPPGWEDGDFVSELRMLAALTDPNVSRLLGVSRGDTDWAVLQYSELGDLAMYLQYHAVTRPPLSVECLTFMSMQIASGMKYLESRNLVHKDLAARNCLLARGYLVKVADLAMGCELYKRDYCPVGGSAPIPIRWLPWESILLDRYSCASSVWMFGVTVWEILSLAGERPFQHLSNEQVIQNAEHMYYGNEMQVFLPKPTICPPELYGLMCDCWKRDESMRPRFKEIYLFLKYRGAGDPLTYKQ